MGKGVDIHCKTKQKRLIMTSIEWLIEQFNLQAYSPHIEQAKEMHKKEIIDAFKRGLVNDMNGIEEINSEQYYKETFEDANR
jgi:hypothetical protein